MGNDTEPVREERHGQSRDQQDGLSGLHQQEGQTPLQDEPYGRPSPDVGETPCATRPPAAGQPATGNPTAGQPATGNPTAVREWPSWKSCVRLVVTALAVYLLIRYWDSLEGVIGLFLNAVAAMLAGAVIAYFVNIPLRFFERHLPGPTGDGTRNCALSLALALIVIVAVVLAVSLLVFPQLVSAIVQLAVEAPNAIKTVTSNDVISSFIPAQLLQQLETIDWKGVINDAASWLQSGIVSSLPQIVSLFSQVAAWFMGIVFALWYLAEKNKIGAQAHRLVRSYMGIAADEKLVRVVELFDDCFHRYIVAQLLEATIFGSLVAAGSALLGLPYALMLGALVGAMSLIPMVGAIVGAVLGAFMVLSVSWQKALVFVVVFFVAQQIEANFVYARVVGKRVRLTGMWPLIGITVGGALFGIPGAFVGVPMTSALFRIVSADLETREAEVAAGQDAPLQKLRKSLAD